MKNQSNKRISFGKIPDVIDAPDLLNIQLESWEAFLQADSSPSRRKNKGLQSVFKMNFPIQDARENFLLEFVEYYVEKPKYSVPECEERGLTYAVPLKAKLRLSQKAEEGNNYINTIEQDVYLGNLPTMTHRGTFIINGAERVVVSQLHRSPGVFFSESIHPNGTPIFSARIIPFRGSWVEFSTDINNIMYAYIDRKKKFPVTTLLRALGYSSDDEILELFGLVEEIDPAKVDMKEYEGRVICGDVVDRKTGEIFVTKDSVLTEDHIKRIKKANVKKLRFLKQTGTETSVIANTILKDVSRSEEDALGTIYRQLRSGDAPDLDTAKNLIDRLFFNEKRYDLGDVGRYRINGKLGLDIPVSTTTLTKEDIIAIINYLIELQQGKRAVDDIDHLGNRRVRTVGEQIAQQFNIGLARMARTIRERMNIRDNESLTPQDLVNARTITSVINAFFGTNPLSQFMDQTNPLAELTNKRRMSALGPGGLTRERAGFEVRDVHYTHYGRLCPIETPEGPNIGLISSLCIHARVNEFGFIETPYLKVKNSKVSSEEVEFLTAEQEDNFTIGQANAPIDSRGNFVSDRVKARFQGDFPVVGPSDVQYMDVAPNQIVSAAAGLIPFLEHDDANRALMGSNMQRQSVPLLRPEAPLVGTGLEEKIARDSRTLIVAERNGVVDYVDAERVVVLYDIDENSTEALVSFEDKRRVEYKLTKFFRTNQDTCINQQAIIKPGDKIKKGDVLADGPATDGGELALGRNVLVAFMPWNGYNFEDAIIVSERIASQDVFTSIHIEEFELQVRDTKRGEEELTREIPNVSEDATKDLDENGIVRIGAEVVEGDILIGKITPKGESDPTPEEKLLKAIFGEKAGDVKDASLKAPPGMKGVVISTKLFSRKKKDAESKKDDKRRSDALDRQRRKTLAELRERLGKKLDMLLAGEKSAGVRDTDGNMVFRSGFQFKEDTFQTYDDIEKLDHNADWTEDKRKNTVVNKIVSNYFDKLNSTEEEFRHEKNKIQLGDELPPGVVQLAKVYVAKKRKLSVGDKMAGRHGNKGVVSRVVPAADMPFLPDGTPVDIVLNPLGVPSRMNLGQLYETALGWAAKALGVTYASPIFDGATWEDVQGALEKAGLNKSSKSILFDGRTGQQFDQEVTVGQIYMLKLSHLVDDKIHARSIGPYSLITQQPLGGKAQFGGQRFGEMEVWALEGYGAAHVLQEMLTVKSDDVSGRAKVYEAVVKGDNLPESNIPESFNVLVRELMGLGLDVKLD